MLKYICVFLIIEIHCATNALNFKVKLEVIVTSVGGFYINVRLRELEGRFQCSGDNNFGFTG